jgi:hypothetical protein
MNNVTLPLLFFAVLLIGISDAFSTNKNHRQQIMHRCSATTATTTTTTTTTLLMSEEDQEQETTTSSSDDDNKEEEEEEEDEKEEVEEEEKKPEDTPEVKDLKEKIAKLESTLAEKKSSLQYNLEQIEEYSKSGYARKVAEMENMKRVRSVSFYLFIIYFLIYRYNKTIYFWCMCVSSIVYCCCCCYVVYFVACYLCGVVWCGVELN